MDPGLKPSGNCLPASQGLTGIHLPRSSCSYILQDPICKIKIKINFLTACRLDCIGWAHPLETLRPTGRAHPKKKNKKISSCSCTLFKMCKYNRL